MAASWMNKGHSGLNEEAEEAQKGRSMRRFWMKPGAQTDVTFLGDHPDLPIRYHEHQVNIKGSWMNWATCPGEDTCPLCAIGDQPSFVAAWPIIDHTQFKTKKGQVVRDQLRLFVAKSGVITKLTRKSEYFRNEVSKKTGKPKNANGLAGIKVTVARGTQDKSPSTGDDFDNWTRGDKELIAKLLADMPSLEDVLAPNMLQLKRFARILGAQASGGSTKGGDDEFVDDDDSDVSWND